MAEYNLIQTTSNDCDDNELHHLSYPRLSMSDDGSRVVFPMIKSCDYVGWSVRMFQRINPDAGAMVLNDSRHDTDYPIISHDPMISGNGQKIVFSSKGFCTERNESGIYIYDIESETSTLVVPDNVPRYENYAERTGEQGLMKTENSHPCISSDGTRLFYLSIDYEWQGRAIGGSWLPKTQRLMVDDISGSRRSGTSPLHVQNNMQPDQWKIAFYGLSMSGDGRTMAFFCGSPPEGLPVENLTIPPNESSPLYCYVLHHRGQNRFSLQVVPDPEHPDTPLIIRNSPGDCINSFSNAAQFGPSIANNGSRIALHAGFEMGSAKTGVYIYEPGENRTHCIIRFREEPGLSNNGLNTGAYPTLSRDGRIVAYYRRSVRFIEGYAHNQIPDESYCPCVGEDQFVVQELRPRGNTLLLVENEPPLSVRHHGACINLNGDEVAFVHRINSAAAILPSNHQVYFAHRLPEGGRGPYRHMPGTE